MEFFEKAFKWLAGVSEKLPQVNTKVFFIVVLAVILGLGIVIAFTLLGSRARKLFVSSRKIRKYLANVDCVDDDNVSDFTAHCFSKKTPQALRDAWVQYLGVRFGYPSDIVSDSAVYDKFVKKNKDVRSGVFLAVSLVLLALFAFWGYGTLASAEMGVVHLAALLLIGVIYLVLIILARKQNQRCLEAFDAMQEDLDAKVNLQIESNYATDSSPLQELNALVEEIIARNTAKVVEEDENEQTPIEALIEQKIQEQNEVDEREASEQESIDELLSAQEDELEEKAEEEDEQTQELLDEQYEQYEIEQESEEADDSVEETVEESAEEEQVDDAVDESQDDEPLTQDTEEDSLQELPEETQNEEPIIEETPQDEIVEEETPDVEPQEEAETVEEEQTEEEIPQSEETEESDEQTEQEPLQENEDEEESFQDSQIEETEEEQLGEEENVEQDVQQDESEPTEEETEESFHQDESVEESEETESSDSDVEEETEDESEEESNDEDEEESEEVEEAQEDAEPEVVYVVDGDEDDEEQVKPAKLVKLPNLVDYMLSKDMPRAMKIQIATMLIGTYNKFKDSKEDRKIVVSCLGKVMRDLQSNN